MKRQLSKQQFDVLDYINDSIEIISIIDLCHKFSISDRTLRKIISNLNAVSEIVKLKRGQGYYIARESKDEVEDIIQENLLHNYLLYSGDDERIDYIIGKALISEKPVSMSQIAEKFYISKSSVQGDMIQARKWFEENQITFIVSSKGQSISLSKFERIKFLVNYISNNFDSVTMMERFFNNIFEYVLFQELIEVVHRFLISEASHTSDSNTIFFISWIIVLMNNPLVEGDFSINNSIDNSDIFARLRFTLQRELTIELSEVNWNIIEYIFNRVILGYSTVEERQLSKDIVNQFSIILSNEYGVLVQEKYQERLELQIRKIIRNIELKFDRGAKIDLEIQNNFPLAYEISMIFSELFAENNLQVSQSNISYLGLIVNDMITDLFRETVELLVVSNLPEIFENYLSDSILKTVNTRNVLIKTLSLYEFNNNTEYYSSSNVIVLDIGNKLGKVCKDLKISQVSVNPLFTEKDVKKISNLLIQKRKVMRKARKIEAAHCILKKGILNYAYLNHDELITMLNFYGVRRMCFINDVLIVKSNANKNHLDIIALKDKVFSQNFPTKNVIFYSVAIDSDEKEYVKIIEPLLVKNLSKYEKSQLKDKKDLLSLLLGSVENDVSLE